ncbi:unnamed protein product [Adineta steineri]|uniref:Uncharacterized protein n=2 Tax=Adineta steineri TaxID=433720 RepID=A0A815KVE7_9BILA|nr:unnamed protein product [Adineta steineri]
MAMAMENDKTLCDICNEEKLTHLCEGCSKKFCSMDLTEHHQMLTNELRQIDIDYAQDCKKFVMEYLATSCNNIQMKLADLHEQTKQTLNDNDFNEVKIYYLKNQLIEIRQVLDNPTKIIIKDLQPFITQGKDNGTVNDLKRFQNVAVMVNMGCNEENIIYPSKGCAKEFCFDHIKQHQIILNVELHNIIDDHYQYEQRTREQKENPYNQLLINDIDKWEKKFNNKQQIVKNLSLNLHEYLFMISK